MGTISHLPRRDRPQAARLETEVEAEAALDSLLRDWQGADLPGLAERREALKLSGLTAISLASDAGGLDCPNRLLTEAVRRLHEFDPDGAEALARHFALLEHFRAGGDESFQTRLADQVFSGDLFFLEPDPAFGTLSVTQQDFQPLASGSLLLPASALWADWLWIPARSNAVPAQASGAVLVPVRSGVFESVADTFGKTRLAATFDDAPAAYAQWNAAPPQTGPALHRLLEAARHSTRLSSNHGTALSGAALRLSLAHEALLALVEQAAQALDQAQVDQSPEAITAAVDLSFKAALFAADLCGEEAEFERLAAEREARLFS